MDLPPAKKSRKAIKNSQRKALRAWYNDSNGKQSLQSAGQWWLRTYGYVLNSSTCSEILSQKWAFLDDTTIATMNDPAKGREAQWKELEEALFKWQQRYETGNNPLTGAILREKALELWRELPCYQGIPPPKLSEGWLTRFKQRHNIGQRKVSKVSIQEALSALQTLKRYEEQQASGNLALIKVLRQRERQLLLCRNSVAGLSRDMRPPP